MLWGRLIKVASLSSDQGLKARIWKLVLFENTKYSKIEDMSILSNQENNNNKSCQQFCHGTVTYLNPRFQSLL